MITTRRFACLDEVIQDRRLAAIGDDLIENPALGDVVEGRLDALLCFPDVVGGQHDDRVESRTLSVRTQNAVDAVETLGKYFRLRRRQREHQVAVRDLVAAVIGPSEILQRRRPLRRCSGLEDGAAKVVSPDQHQHDIEDHAQQEPDRHDLDAGGKANRNRQEDEDDVSGIGERRAKAHRGNDTRKAERQRQAVAHDQHDAGNDHRQHDQHLHHGLIVTLRTLR